MIFWGGSCGCNDLKVAIILLQSLNPVVVPAVFWKLFGLFAKGTSKEDWDVAHVKHVLIFISLVKSKVWQIVWIYCSF